MTMRKIATPSLLDRAIASVAPGFAVRRLRSRAIYDALSGGYIGGRGDRRATSSWRPGGGSADADAIPDLALLRERTRDAARNTPIAAGAHSRVVTNVVGAGLLAAPKVDRAALKLSDEAADAWEKRARALWQLWSNSQNCDATRTQTFVELQDLALRATLESGDCFNLRQRVELDGWPFKLALQFYEADQVANPKGLRDGAALQGTENRVAGGVEYDKAGAPVAYHFLKTHPGDLSGVFSGDTVRIPAFGAASGRRLVDHLFVRRRIGLHRGVPLLAPVIESLKQLGTYSQAELMAAVIGAMIAVVHKQPSGEGLPAVQPTDETGALPSDQDIKFAAGTVLELGEPGESVDVPTLGRPNPQFNAFFESIVREIGAALEIPSEVLLQSFTASYSASRAALEMAWQFFRRERQWLVRNLCQPIYEEFITECVTAGLLGAPGFFADPLVRQAWLECDWIGPARISLDPLKENSADETAEAHGWKTAAQITREKTGGDYFANIEQRAKEQRAKEAAGLMPAAPANDIRQGGAPQPPRKPDPAEPTNQPQNPGE